MAKNYQTLLKQSKEKETAWKQSLRNVHDEPNYIFYQIEGLLKELQHDNPDIGYMKEKVEHINNWIDEIAKFHKLTFK